MKLTEEQISVIIKVIQSEAVQNLIGSGEWSLTEEEELILWGIINSSKDIVK